MSDYKNYVIKEDFFSNEIDLRLESTYELCITELGLQQSKRDQTIAFYIAVISFVIPAIISMEINNYAKAAGFIALYILGGMMAKVVVRYRIYKEVYWITCRTISQLYNIDQSKICKQLVQHIFYTTLCKNMSSVLVFNKKQSDKVDCWRSFRKIRNSAETTLYEVLVLLSSLVLWIGVYTLIPISTIAIITATVLTIINYVYWCIYYYKRLTNVYAVYIDGSDESFNDTYAKAWFLHSFYK